MDQNGETTPKTGKKRTFKGHIEMNMIYEYLSTHRYTPGLPDSEKRSVRKRAKSFFVRDKELFFIGDGESNEGDKKRERLVPRSLEERWKIIAEEHVDNEGNHLGMEKTTKLITEKFYWVGISLNVRDYIKRCAYCIARNAQNNIAVDSCRDFADTTFLNNSHMSVDGDAGEMTSKRDILKQETFDEIPLPPTTYHFWDKVEMQVLGPFGKEKKYVLVFLDTFSLWPEAVVLETVSPATVTHYLLSLICRYGEMNNLLLRSNDDPKLTKFTPEDIEPRLDLLNTAGFKICIDKFSYPDTDETWKVLTKAIKSFVKNYGDSWRYCLDVCLMPHRISRPVHAEYTPAYLTFGREPRLPTSLSHRHGNSVDPHLTESQIQDTLSSLMELFGGYQPDLPTRNPPGVTPVVLPVPAGKVKVTTFTVPAKDADKYTSGNMPPPPGARGYYFTSNEENSESMSTSPSVGTRKRKMLHGIKEEVGNHVRKTNGEDKGSEKKTPGCHEFMLDALYMEDDNDDHVKNKAEHNYALRSSSSSTVGSEKVDLDSFYEAVLFHSTKGRHLLPKSSSRFKHCVRAYSQKLVVEKEKLYYEDGKKLRELVMTHEARMSLIMNAHVNTLGAHACKRAMMEKLKPYYWKGMANDCEDYIQSCSLCPLMKNLIPLGVTDDTFLNIIQFLKSGKFSDGCDKRQQSTLKKMSSQFFLEDGRLYVRLGSGEGGRREVLTCVEDKRKAVQDAHSQKGQHLDVQATISMLQRKYFWQSVENDIVKDVIAQCGVCRQQEDKPVIVNTNPTSACSEDSAGLKNNEAGLSKENSLTVELSETEPDQKNPMDDAETGTSVAMETSVDSPSNDFDEKIDNTEEQSPLKCPDKESNEAGNGSLKEGRNTRNLNTRKEVTDKAEVLSRNTGSPGSSDMVVPQATTSNAEASRHDGTANMEAPSATVSHAASSCHDESTNMASPTATVSHASPSCHDRTSNMAVPSASVGHVSPSCHDGTSNMVVPSATVSHASPSHDGTSNMAVPSTTVSHAAPDYPQGTTNFTTVSSANVSSPAYSVAPQNGNNESVPDSSSYGTGGDGRVRSTQVLSDAVTTAAVRTILQEDSSMTQREVNVVITELQGPQNIELLVEAHETTSKPETPPKLTRGSTVCNICGQKVIGSLKYKLHVYKHTGIKPFQCEVCGKRFTHAKSKRLHMRKHTGNLPYLCSICGKGYPRSGSLAAHMNIHAKGGGMPVACDICDRTFASVNRLSRHKEFKHPATPKIYRCAECHKDFTTARSLKRHTQSYHLKVKHHMCDYCGKGFYRKEYLTSHLSQHTGEPGGKPKRSQSTPKPPRPRESQHVTQSVPYPVTLSDVPSEDQMPNIYYGYATSHPEHDQRVMHVQPGPSGLLFGQPAVQYEVECGTGSEHYDAEALSAINMLAQASVNQGY